MRRTSAAVALVAASYGGYLRYDAATHVSTDDAYLEARVSVVSARVAGCVKEVLVADNEEVERGHVLVRLDPSDARASLEQARAAVAIAEGQYQAAVVGVPLANTTVENQVRQARSALKGAAEGELRRSAIERRRMRSLLRHRIVARGEADDAEAAFRAARAKVQGMRATLSQSKGRRREVEVRQAEMKTAAGLLAQAQARQREAEQRLAYTTIVAPFRGRVTRKNVEVGQTVNVAQPLLAVVSTEQVWVIANFKESQLAKVRAGQRAVIAVDMYPDLTLAARVDSIQAGTGSRFALLPLENASGNYVKVVQRVPVKLVLEQRPPPDRPLFPGLSVVPTIEVGSAAGGWESRPRPPEEREPADQNARLSQGHGRDE